MDKDQEFNRRISALHGLDNVASSTAVGNAELDVRHEEFRAMTETYLGPYFDEVKLDKIENLQIELDDRHAELFSMFEGKQLSAGDFVDASNSALKEMYARCEKILGEDDFEKLFGGSPEEAGGYIDKDAFLNPLQ